jgi:hypothetical protein
VVVHCWNRCVRRAYLCGEDRYSGRNYEHRRDWIWDVQEQLAGLFGIEIEFRAEMQNHFHVVLRTRPDVVRRWPREKVVVNWLKIVKLRRGSSIEGWEPPEARVKQYLRDPDYVKQLARRLSNVSWFMGTLSENIARRANREDGCSGRFFQGRFSCRVLDNEQSLLECSIYVDLNVIRAGEAATPESSRHTSAYDRIQACLARAAAKREPGGLSLADQPDRWMSPLELQVAAEADPDRHLESPSGCRASDKGVLPMDLATYLQLLEWTGRQLRADKRGSIPASLAPIFERLGLDSGAWFSELETLETQYRCPIADADQLRGPPST